MIELNDISFKEYVNLDDKSYYDYALKYSYTFNKKVDVFEVGSLQDKTFGFVKDLQYSLNDGLDWAKYFEYVNILTGIDYNKLSSLSLSKLSQFRSYLVSEIEIINQVESIALASTITSDEQQAGIERFNELGSYMQFRSLTNGDVTKMESVRQTKYDVCLLELIAQKKLSDFERELIRIRKSKNN